MQQFSKKIILTFVVVVLVLAACKSKPSVDKSVNYENQRSIPSLQVPIAEEKDK